MGLAFTIASTPLLVVGAGKISELPSLIKRVGSSVMLVTGARSFITSSYGTKVMEDLGAAGISIHHIVIEKEPSPSMIDHAVLNVQGKTPDVVVAIGGGSVVDAGKAIAAMLLLKEPVKDYLEGVGTKPVHPGTKVPFIAVPTTAGTGSEATKNAVLSEVGEHGFKKSLRHNNFVPNVAILDPALTVSCSPFVTATSGMDSFTQLLESYLSTTANPITDALAYEGLTHISSSLFNAYENGQNIEARLNMSLAAYLSGITLANAGLGIVHGFASAIGGLKEIPHGVVCSALMQACNIVTVRKLRNEKHTEALSKYAAIGKLFSGEENKSGNFYIDYLLEQIKELAEKMKIPTLKDYGISSADYQHILKNTDNKNNPVKLERDEMVEVLEMAG